MADSVTSQVQHITALDFDVTKALQQLQELQDRFNAITQEIASRNWTIKAVLQGDEELDKLENNAAGLAEQISNLENEIKNNNAATVNSFSQVNQQLKQTGSAFNSASGNVAEYNDGLENTNKATNELNNTTSTLISTIEGKLVSALSQAAKAGYEAVKSTEDSMVEIGRVLDTTASETETLRGSLFELGNEYGRSFEDVSDVALRFAQAGYDNINDVLSNTSAMLLAMNTAEIEASSGTTELIGIMSQWGMTADELVTIIDKLNYTADNNAITTQDLADALLKASSMAKTAGMSFDDTVGVLTAMKVASGAAGKEVGNAFKSIIAYIERPDSLKLFDSMGIDVFKDKVTGELLPMMDILKSMSEKWNGNQEEMLNTLIESGDAAQMMSEEWAAANGVLDKYNQYQEAAAAATDKANDAESRAQAQAAAGVFRRNYYIALMENFNKAVEVSADLINSEGHSAAENARYMETLTAKTEQLVVSLTELAVTAADAGLLDLAKSAIDTATAFVKWTTESNNLVPILKTVAGILITIKAQKMAEEFTAIIGSFGNALNAFKVGINTLRGVETAASGATTAASGLSSALGVLGIAITVFSGITTAINAYEQSIRQARQETIDAAESEKEKYELLKESENIYDELSQRYEELREKTNLTAEEQTELDDITAQLTETQDKLTEAYRDQADSIDLINGKRAEQINALKELKAEELQYLANTQRAAVKAKKINNNQSDTVVTGQYELEDKSGLDSIISSNFNVLNGAKFTISESFGKSKIEVQATTESLEDLKIVLKEIEESGGKSTAEWSMFYDAIRGVEAELQNTKEMYAELAETEFLLYNSDHNFEDIGRDGYLDWRKGLLETAEGDTELENALLDTVSEKFPQYKALNDYSKDLKAIENMTTAEKAYYFAKKNSADVTEASAKAAKTYSKAAEETAEVIGLTDEELKKLASTISDAESNITDLNKYMETLSEGNGLTAQEVMELCETYGLLADQFTLTENGYTIEISALEKLRDEQIKTAVTARLEQAGYTKDVLDNILKRVKAYSDEVTSISSVAEAQATLRILQAEMNNLAQDGGHNKEAMKELSELMAKISEYSNLLTNIEALQNGVYDNFGKSFGDSKKGADDADDGFKSLVESIERLGEMGVYSLQETIDKFEELRRTAGLTEEQIKTVEDNLHELYSSQIEEHLKAAEQEKKDYIDSVKEKYDEDKEALEKVLENEKELFKQQQEDALDARKKYWEDELDNLKDNLNAQINASKKAYESKKKLYEKSYDNQKEALESLRDLEIESIKASYNARIDALQKMKAARKAERDDEDYQDERNEILKQISYWEQRTGTEAAENLEKLKKELADLDKQHKRDVEDRETDNEIDDLEKQRDEEAAAVKAQYDAQIAALESAKKTELEIYESTYNAEQEMLKAKLEKDVKAMEEARDADLKTFKRNQKQELKQLEEQQEKQLKDLEDEKDAAIKAAEDKWKRIEQIFNDSNIAMIASAGIFANDLYDQFNREFTKNFEMDLDHLSYLISSLNSRKSRMEAMSGTTPTDTYSSGGSSGSGNSSSGNSSKKKKKKDDVVGASTGGKTTADGLVMLHKNELIINPPTTKKLEDLLESLAMPKTGIVIDPSIMRRINKSASFFHAPRGNSYNTNNNYNSNSYDNSRPVIQNFNAPLQNIEKIEDAADLEAATNALERKIMRELSTKL